VTLFANRNTLILSDAHLCEVIGESGTWMPYRQRAYIFDDGLASLIDDAIRWSRSDSASLEIVFNGDIFDFNAPDLRVATAPEVPASISREEPGAAQLISNILDDHPAFVNAVGRALAADATVVFISGNHDAQLVFPEVRVVISNFLMRAAIAAGSYEPRTTLNSRIIFRSWFHHTSDGFHIEHGHQYDPLCALTNMLPTYENGRLKLEDTIESVASYYAQPLFDGIDLCTVSPFDVRSPDLLKATYCCATRGGTDRMYWYAKALIQLIQQIALNNPVSCCSPEASVQHAAHAETGVGLESLRRHQAFFVQKTPIEHVMVSDIWKTYEKVIDGSLRSAATGIAGIYGARGVIMGHTHRLYGTTVDGVFYGNTGSWTPASGSFGWIATTARGTHAGTYERP
jgi:UDP-2,3-diacylglucosamine pyrophosphatase LpxH